MSELTIEDAELFQMLYDVSFLVGDTRADAENWRDRMTSILLRWRGDALDDFVKWYNAKYDTGYSTGIAESRVQEFFNSLSEPKK